MGESGPDDTLVLGQEVGIWSRIRLPIGRMIEPA
jgi:hypothetical protein